MKNILTVFKKEWDRVIKDRRLVIMVILFPGLMIYVIYSFMGFAINNSQNADIDVAIVNSTNDFKQIYESQEDTELINIKAVNVSDIDEYKQLIDEEEWELLIIFPDDLTAYDGTGDKPEVIVYDNPNNLSSSNIRGRFINYLIAYEQSLAIDLYGDRSYFALTQDQTPLDENQLMGSVLGQLMPMLIIMFLFSGAMSIAPEAIAGEKERNTLATILITPIKRKELAMGKILGLSVIAFLSAISSFIGIIISLPKLINYEGANIAIYDLSDYFLILLILMSTIFVIIGIISIVSAYAKSVKEAGSYVGLIYILTIIVAIGTSFSNNSDRPLLFLALPLYNSVESLKAIMTFADNAVMLTLITFFVNLVYLTIFVTLLNKMFNSEKIMFAK